MPIDNKKSLHSRVTTVGLDRTPHRAFLRGMGLDDMAISKPFIVKIEECRNQQMLNDTFDVLAADDRIRNIDSV